jgi:cysteine desulfuration protein SufE
VLQALYNCRQNRVNHLQDIIKTFQSTDDDFKLELLLDYSDRLPSPSPDFLQNKERNVSRISECQTPVYISITAADGKVVMQADVPPESPTVRGIVSIIWYAIEGLDLDNLMPIPLNLLNQLGLTRKIGMLRLNGITAILRRVNQQIEMLIIR